MCEFFSKARTHEQPSFEVTSMNSIEYKTKIKKRLKRMFFTWFLSCSFCYNTKNSFYNLFFSIAQTDELLNIRSPNSSTARQQTQLKRSARHAGSVS